jgi:hypothetical protein
LTVTVLVAGSLGYLLGQRSKADAGARTGGLDLFGARTKNLLEIERAKIMGLDAEWLGRFSTAFSSQPPEVAIWEGTNLLSYLTGKTAVVPAGNFTNDVMLTHIKLSGLYMELGATNEAQFHLSEVVRMRRERFPNQDLDVATIREGVRQFTEKNRKVVATKK